MVCCIIADFGIWKSFAYLFIKFCITRLYLKEKEMKSLRKYGLLVSMVTLALVIVFGQFSDVVSACGTCTCTREMVMTSGTRDWVKIMEGGGRWKRAVETWVHPWWPTIEGAAWISSSYHVEEPEEDSWRKFTRIFCIPGCVVSASMNISGDNAYKLYVNGKLVGSDGTVYGPAEPDPYEWSTIEEYDLTSTLRPCLNWIKVVVRNYKSDGGTWEINPTGLVYRIHITYKVRC